MKGLCAFHVLLHRRSTALCHPWYIGARPLHDLARWPYRNQSAPKEAVNPWRALNRTRLWVLTMAI